MKLDIFIGKNEPGWSLNVLGYDIAATMEELGWDTKVCSSMGQFRSGATVLNLMLEEVSKVEKSRRFNGIGSQFCFFAGNTEDYSELELIGHLLYGLEVPIVTHSEYHYQRVREAITHYLHPMVARSLLPNVKLIWGGPTSDFKPKPQEEQDSNATMLVPCNRINQGQKNLGKHLYLSEKLSLLCARHNIPIRHDFILKDDGSKDRLSEIDPQGYYHAIPQPSDREKYKELIRDYKVAICTSRFESLGLMYLELLLSGVVVVFLDKPWVRELLPGYKFVAKSDDELQKMAFGAIKNYDKARAYVLDSISGFIVENRSHNSFCEGLSQMMKV